MKDLDSGSQSVSGMAKAPRALPVLVLLPDIGGRLLISVSSDSDPVADPFSDSLEAS
ncbi:hypothetical protein [Pseudomonas defluvii]|uniref:hypothetical protein n=1 Tax=Pseudomonas defluvii TaxID=1876757 RepID=UPI001FDFD101|nr:hypothetical protein [Pseudomonas defluvii]